MRSLLQFLSVLVLLNTLVVAGKYQFKPVPAAEWLVEVDSSNTKGAVLLQQIINVDDQNINDSRIKYEVFVRVRIVNEVGREQAKVTIPYVHRKSKVEEIQGRCVLPDGQIIRLEKAQIKEQELAKTKGIRVKQKTFTVPGVTDDCIVEYYYRIRAPRILRVWYFQSDIPLEYGELNWKFYRGKGIPFGLGGLLQSFLTPNYTWENFKDVEVKKLPEGDDNPKEVKFIVQNVPALIDEPHSPPEVSRRGQIHYYYSGTENVQEFWGSVSTGQVEQYQKFTKKNKRARPLLESWAGLENNSVKMKTAYDWLQENILNIDYDGDEDTDYKYNKNLDDMLKRKYGNSSDINNAYLYFLKEFGVSAHMVYTHDREERHFFPSVKNSRQFDRSFVVTPKGARDYYYYSPAEPGLPYREIPWYYQGAVAFMIDEARFNFSNVPIQPHQGNRFRRFLWLTMDEDFQLSGKMLEQFEGQYGYRERLQLEDLSSSEIDDYFSGLFKEQFPAGEIDSVKLEKLDEFEKKLSLKCLVNLESEVQEIGSKRLIKPVEMMSLLNNPFVSDGRSNDIVFDHAGEEIESITLDLPEGWVVDALPETKAIVNRVGTYNLLFQSLNNGTRISIQRSFKLKHPWLTSAAYLQVQKLFNARQAQEDLTAILKPAAD